MRNAATTIISWYRRYEMNNSLWRKVASWLLLVHTYIHVQAKQGQQGIGAVSNMYLIN